jgi:hypothetical protein
MGKIVVTTCSLNHLAQAKGLGDSLIKYNPEYKLLIGLVDRLEGRVLADYYYPHDVVEAHALQIPEFKEMSERYTPLELNCALKSFFCDYALNTYHAEEIIFLDSDILVFDSLQYIEEQLQQCSILLSPHITIPYPDDGCRPVEREMLKNGVFNAGFFAFKNDSKGRAFLSWLKKRMVHEAHVNAKEGLNADQTWFNLVPLYFKGVCVLEHPGCNAAYWNLHERSFSKTGEKYLVNEQYSLLFFHFSGYSLIYPGKISRHQNRIILEEGSVLKELVQLYHDTLIKNDHPQLLSLENAYGKQSLSKKIKKVFKR